ncbi:MAG TPA: TIGR02996 domain-containing protein [Gemmataceae bacterium]|nr:TIGR02996 domain-containing protein [Gemmataceae bacterium]
MTESDFLAAIRAAPDNDAVRLIYADWLDEQGESLQAEYVRTAVEYGTIKDEYDPRKQALFDREQELERLHSDTWRQRLAGYLPDHLRSWCWSDLHFARGLPGWVNANVSRFAQDAEALMRVFPITSAHLGVMGAEDIALLGSLAAFRSCRWLGLHAPPELGTVTIRAIVTSPHLGQLKSLQLFDLTMGDEGLIALAEAAERFPHLEMLELTRTGVTGIGVAALARSPLMTHLKNLWLRENAIGPEGLRALAEAEAPVLEELWLPETQLGNVGTILATAQWPALWRLDLDNSGLTPSSVSALLRAEWFPRLRDLSLRGLAFSRRAKLRSDGPRPVGLRCLSIGSPTLSDAGLLRLLKPYQFPELRSLWISDSQIGDDAIAALTAHPCEQLSDLYLMDNQIGSAGAWRLITSSHLPALRKLTLSRNRVGESALLDTAAPPTEPHLTELDLTHNPMTPEVGRALLSRSELALLEQLKLSYSYLGPEGGRILARSSLTSTLRTLLVCGTGLGDEGVIALLDGRFVGALRDLSLQRVGLAVDGLSALVRSKDLASLLSLRLDRNPLGPEAGRLLTTAPWLPRLTCLILSDTAVGDEGVAALAACPGVCRLGFLGLNAVGLTAAGVRALLDSPHLPHEMRVHLAGNAAEIQERLGDALAQRFAEVDYDRYPHIDLAW